MIPILRQVNSDSFSKEPGDHQAMRDLPLELFDGKLRFPNSRKGSESSALFKGNGFISSPFSVVVLRPMNLPNGSELTKSSGQQIKRDAF